MKLPLKLKKLKEKVTSRLKKFQFNPSARHVPPPMKTSAQLVLTPMKTSAQPVPQPMKPSARPVPPPMKPSARPVPQPMKTSAQPVPPPMKPPAQPVPPMNPPAQPLPQVIKSKLKMTDNIIRRYKNLEGKIKDYNAWMNQIKNAAERKNDNDILLKCSNLEYSIKELSTIFANNYYDYNTKQYKFSDRSDSIDFYGLSDKLDSIVFYYDYILNWLKRNYNIHYSETFKYFFSEAGEKPEKKPTPITLNNSNIADYNSLKPKINDYKKWRDYIIKAARGDYHISLQSNMLDNSIKELSIIFANGYYDSTDPRNLEKLLYSISYHYDNILIALREKYTRPASFNFEDFFTYEEKYFDLKMRGLIPPLPFKIGGKKSKKPPKKEILGKMRKIYKIPGDRKEYVKHKGKLITVKDYKKLMKAKKPKKK